MGTNYYAVTNACECCGRGDKRHVGKSYRTLRAYMGEIESWQDWLDWFSSNEVAIVDEGGREVPLGEFIDRWKPSPDAPRIADDNNQQWFDTFGTDLGDYIDVDGYLLCRRDFS